MNALFEADRIDDVLSEIAALLERPLDADARDYLKSFRHAALGR